MLEACRAEPLTIDDLAGRFERSLGQIALTVARLERDGWLVDSGGWFEAVEGAGGPG